MDTASRLPAGDLADDGVMAVVVAAGDLVRFGGRFRGVALAAARRRGLVIPADRLVAVAGERLCTLELGMTWSLTGDLSGVVVEASPNWGVLARVRFEGESSV